MDTNLHTMKTLFQQLGLPSNDSSMDAFFHNFHLPRNIPLENAAFWSKAQAQFIHEALQEDSDWSEIVDQLNSQLRH